MKIVSKKTKKKYSAQQPSEAIEILQNIVDIARRHWHADTPNAIKSVNIWNYESKTLRLIAIQMRITGHH